MCVCVRPSWTGTHKREREGETNLAVILFGGDLFGIAIKHKSDCKKRNHKTNSKIESEGKTRHIQTHFGGDVSCKGP